MITTEAFTKVAELKAPVRLVCGGTSAGKTYSIIQYLIIYSLNRELSINVVALTSRMLEMGAYGIFIKMLKNMGHYDPKNHNETRKTYKLNKTTFSFFTAENPDTLIGIRGDITFLNEANKIPFESYTQLESRTNLFTFCDWNPASFFWADEYLIGNENVDFIRLTYKDNNQLSQKVIDGIERWKVLGETSKYFANHWLVYGLGMLGKQEGAIYTDWQIIDYLPNEATLIASGMDFGFTNDFSTLISVYKFNDELIVDEIFCKKGLSNPQMATLIKSSDAKNSVIYADCSSPQNISEIKHYGIHILGVTKGAGTINYGIQLIQQNNFKVTARSENLIKELQNYTWSVNKLGESTNEPIAIWNHCLDALRYVFLMKFNNKSTHFNLKWKR
jgi:phage terminase large subunit